MRTLLAAVLATAALCAAWFVPTVGAVSGPATPSTPVVRHHHPPRLIARAAATNWFYSPGGFRCHWLYDGGWHYSPTAGYYYKYKYYAGNGWEVFATSRAYPPYEHGVYDWVDVWHC